MQINPDQFPQVEEDESGAQAPEESSDVSSDIAEDLSEDIDVSEEVSEEVSEDIDVSEEASEESPFPFYDGSLVDGSSESSTEVPVDFSVMTQQIEITNCLLIIIVLLLLIKLISNIMATLFKS